MTSPVEVGLIFYELLIQMKECSAKQTSLGIRDVAQGGSDCSLIFYRYMEPMMPGE